MQTVLVPPGGMTVTDITTSDPAKQLSDLDRKEAEVTLAQAVTHSPPSDRRDGGGAKRRPERLFEGGWAGISGTETEMGKGTGFGFARRAPPKRKNPRSGERGPLIENEC
jgi:hypothetical protein